MGPAIAVCLIENHPLAARLLRQILKGCRNMEIFVNGKSLKQKTAFGERSSVFVIDGDGLPTPLGSYLQSIRAVSPEARILLLGNPLATKDLCRVLLLGIHGFVSYAQIDNLGAAIEAISDGHLWAPPDVLEQFALYLSRLFQSKQRRHRMFTPREELIGLLERRLSNKEIGSALSISERTVRFHLGNIFSKLGVHDRHSVIEVARSRDLPEVAPAPDIARILPRPMLPRPASG